VKLASSNKLHFDLVLLDPESNVEQWHLIGFYSESCRDLGSIELLNSHGNLPWLCAGDFNEVLVAGEQFVGNVWPECQMDDIREAVQVCGFQDLGFSGLSYTWDNR
jgi:hypothetical protein